MRFIAFPSSSSRKIINLNSLEANGWKIIAGPTASGLYLIEASQDAANILQEALNGYYILMEDF